jgi:hypothetical protein
VFSSSRGEVEDMVAVMLATNEFKAYLLHRSPFSSLVFWTLEERTPLGKSNLALFIGGKVVDRI